MNSFHKSDDINKICSIECTLNQNIELKENAIILSGSLFKLNDMYRDISVYVNGFEEFVKYIGNLINSTGLDICIFLYYDQSIENDEKFQKIKRKLNDITYLKLFKYTCPTFVKNDLHYGVFGTFIRFLPLFEKKYLKNLKFITEMDYSPSELVYFFKYMLPKVYNSNNNCVIFQNIGYSQKYANQYKNNFIDGTCMANIFIRNIYLPISILINFLEKVRDKDSIVKNNIETMLKKLSEREKNNGLIKNEFKVNKYKNFGNLFIYGVDELFINRYLLNYIIHKYKKIGIVYSRDNIGKYVNEMIQWDESPKENVELFFKSILKKQYIKNNFTKNIKILNQLLFYYNIKTIKDYTYKMQQIKNYYYKVLEFKDKLKIDPQYLSNLKKYFNTKFQMHFSLIDNPLLLNYIGPRIEIYPLNT